MFDRVADWCVAWGVGHASPEECDELGMSEAQRLAAQRALADIGLPADRVLLDGNWDFVGAGTSELLVKGDARCLSIAAASILAKVTRDRIMRADAEHHRSEEHTSELQSLMRISYAVFCLKKKTKTSQTKQHATKSQ